MADAPIPTPEALYRSLRPEPDWSSNGFRTPAWSEWQDDLDALRELASNPRTEIAAAFMLLGMMEKDTVFEIFGTMTACDAAIDGQQVLTGAPPAGALLAAMGAAIDLRRD